MNEAMFQLGIWTLTLISLFTGMLFIIKAFNMWNDIKRKKEEKENEW